MPTTIKTEAARVALAEREFQQDAAEIQRRIEARMQALRHDPRATDRTAFRRLCIEDRDLSLLLVEVEATKVWRDSVIADGDVATIEDDQQVRRTPR
jgi:hypothetical protein